jgi:hypothetical protein
MAKQMKAVWFKDSSAKSLNLAFLLGGTIWIIGILFGLHGLMVYEGTPTLPKGEASQIWPSKTSLQHSNHMPTLLLFIHPQCPCSRASIAELASILTTCHEKMETHVLFFKPEGFPETWVKSDLWDSAKILPDTDVKIDNAGLESNIFHAEVSGYTLLYDESGKLVFHGGITVARGHMGENQGKDAVLAIVNKKKPNVFQTPVFGCSLLNPS